MPHTRIACESRLVDWEPECPLHRKGDRATLYMSPAEIYEVVRYFAQCAVNHLQPELGDA